MPKEKSDVPEGRERVAEIRAIARAEILSPESGFDTWRYFGELKGLRPKRAAPNWLEAVIMVCAIGRVRPAQTVANMNALRQLREKRGELELFESFQESVTAYLAPQKLTNHSYRTSDFSTLDHGEIWDHVGAVIARLTEAGFEVFLNSGTLLGVVRDGRLIEHDDDIDLAVIVPGGDAHAAAQAWKTLLGEFESLGLLAPEGTRVRGIAKLTPAGEVEIDLFPAWIEDGQVYVYPHTRGELSRDEVLPVKPCPVTGYNIPAEPEKMLALNYGPGWRSPDPLFKFPWTAARRAFAAFLDEAQI